MVVVVESDVDQVALIELGAVEGLLGESRQVVQLGLTELPQEGGIYAIYGDDQAWSDLGLVDETGEGLLYIGLTLGGLNHRVVKTHFSNRKTPWSIIRRTLAGLLQSSLQLEIADAKSAKHRHFGLVPKSDRALSKWMRNHLQVGFWQTSELAELQAVEQGLLGEKRPVLSPSHAPKTERARMEGARLAMVGIDVGQVSTSDLTLDTATSAPQGDEGLVIPAPLLGLLEDLERAEPLLSLVQKKPTWVSHRTSTTLYLQTSPPTDSAANSSALEMAKLVQAYEVLIGEGALQRGDLVGSAKRRSAFVLALLAGLEGVDVTQAPLVLTYSAT